MFEEWRPTGIALGPILYNIYTFNLPSLLSKKYAYAGNLSLLHTLNNWKSLEVVLNRNIITFLEYLQIWRLT